MKSVRLLPVVIAAAGALLLLKGVGIATNGGYVLSGLTAVQAAGAATEHGGAEAANDATMHLQPDPTLTDPNPVLQDAAPTLPTAAGAADEHAQAAGHGPADAHAEEPACPEPGSGEAPAAGLDCPIDPGVNAAGDSLPVMQDGAGNVVPMDATPGAEQAVLERLGDRREALEVRESELEMRMALVEAAEKRLADRTAALEALEARVNSLVSAQKTEEAGQFASIVAMYEAMKPKDAALIFDQLEMPVLLRVASAMSPRKMGPIMARMDPTKAKDLTANMAIEQAEVMVAPGAEDLGSLPQIVGQ